jgi:hypothetical protein
MKQRLLYLLCLMAVFTLKAAPLCAQQQQPKAPPSPAEFAEQEVARCIAHRTCGSAFQIDGYIGEVGACLGIHNVAKDVRIGGVLSWGCWGGWLLGLHTEHESAK